jgi:hypothetical protein
VHVAPLVQAAQPTGHGVHWVSSVSVQAALSQVPTVQVLQSAHVCVSADWKPVHWVPSWCVPASQS